LSPRTLLLFTKPAVPGRVKTRLVGELSAAQAARVHAAFLGDLVERLESGSFALRLAWALEPGEAMPESRHPGLRQHGGDLGARLYDALATAARHHPLVAAVGSDHPDLPLERVEDAFERLAAGVPVVLGPAEDGGYYLVGMRREALRPELFQGIPWSTPKVLAVTLERCRRLGLAVHLLPSGQDVDTPEDLRRLAAALAAGDLGCPRTRALLEELGWLG
jgi:uncharacterized protein